MHGILKVRTTEEQKLIKQKEQTKKLKAYQHGMETILSSRHENPYNTTSFSISTQLLLVIPDIYTLWNYRKEVTLQEIERSKNSGDVSENIDEKLIQFLENEIGLAEQCLLTNPKSYSAWHHRFWILERHPKPNWDKEFKLCTKYLSLDDRNFHVWDYRRLILSKIGIDLVAELQFSKERINVNFSNYSSWHYRSTLNKLDEDTLEEELNMVQNAVFTDPNDSSAWFYLRWVLSNPAMTDKHRKKMIEDFNQLLELDPDCKWIYMAKCWSTGSLSLSDKNYIIDRIDCYKKLLDLDPMRSGQYEHYLKLSEDSLQNT